MRSWLEKVILLIVCFCVMGAGAYAQQAPALGALYEFGALASSGISNTGNTVVQAKVGLTSGKISGFPPGVAVQGLHVNDLLAKQAVTDARSAMTFLAAQTSTSTIPAGDISGRTITPGVHTISGNAFLNGKLTFDGQNKTSPVFIIRVSGTLDIVKAEYELLNNAASINLYWLVEGDVTVRKSAAALGNIFSNGDILMEDGAQLQGRLIAPSIGSKGNITFANNAVNYPADIEVILTKEPGSKGEDTYAFGEQVTYYITIKNNGPTNAENVRVFGSNLAGVVLNYTSSKPGVTFDNLTWFLGNLNYKEEVIITVTAKTDKAGILSSTASVSGSGVDEIRRNNSSNLSFCVLLSETGEITGAAEVCLGDEFVYSIVPVEGATSYAWSVPSGWSFVPLGSPGISTSIRVKVGTEPTQDNIGFVKVTASNTCGEGPARTFEVRVQADVPPQPGPISGPIGVCKGATGIAYSIAPVANATSYAWKLPNGWTFVSGQGTTSIVVNPGSNSGNIEVIASNSCGPSEPQTLYVQVDDGRPSAPTEIIGTVQGCVGNTVTFEVAAIPTVTNYNWTVPTGWQIVEGQGTRTILVKVGSSAGNVSVQVSNGCGASDPISKPVAPVAAPASTPGQITGDVNSCINQTGLVYSIESVTAATRYEWKVPAGWQIVSGQGTTEIIVNTNASGGDVTVVAWNDCGPSNESKLTVVPVQDVPLQPGSISGVQYGCVGGTATYSIDKISGANSYAWTVPTGWTIITGQGTATIEVTTGSSGGKVAVSAVNGCGTGASSTLDVSPQTQPPLPPAPINGPGEVCEGQAGYEYSVTPIAGVNSYTWTVPTGWTITAGQGTSTITVTAGKLAGQVTVKGENDCGVGTAAAEDITVVPSPPAQPGDISGPPSVCVGQKQVTYSIEPVAFASNYIWSVGNGSNGWQIVSGQGTTSIVVNAGSAPTIITVQAENACGITGETQLTTIMTDQVPLQPGPISGVQYGCVGGTATYSIDKISGANSYTWTVPTGWTIITGQGTATIEVTTGSSGGKVAVSAVNGCGTGASSTLDVSPQTQPPLPPAPINGPGEVCEGQAGYEYSVTPIAGVNSYTWTVPTGWTITAGQGTSTITVTAGKLAGQVTVKGENDCGVGTAAAEDITVVPSPPAQPGDISGPPSVCVGQKQVTYSIEPVAFASNYIWSVGNGSNGWQIVSGQGTTSIVVNAGSAPTIITVQAENACGITGETQLTTIMTDQVPLQPGPISGTTVTCAGGTYTFSIDPVKDAYKYNWSFPTGWEVLEDNGTTISVKTNGTGGAVSVTAQNGCGPGAAQTLDVTPTNTAPAMPEAILGNADVCIDTEATFSVSEVNGAASYVWVVPAGWSIITGQGTPSITVKVGTTAGTIKVTSKNDCGTSATASKKLVLNTAPPATPGQISGSPQVCTNSNVTYTIAPVNTAYTYTWKVPAGWEILNGQGSQSIEVKVGANAGEVTVIANNSCGESGMAKLAVDVAENTPVNPGAITGPAASFCEGTAGLTYSIKPVNGAVSYTWSVPTGWTITNGQGTTSITVTAGAAAGDVKVTAVNACGNGGSSSKPVLSQTTPLTPTISLGPINPCQDVTTTYSVTASTNGNVDTYIWEVPKGWQLVSGQNTNTIEVIANGTSGKVKVTAKNSCQTSGTAEIDVVPSPAMPATPSAILGTPEVCASTTVTYAVENPSKGATYTWQVPQGWEITAGQGTATISVITGPGAGIVTVTGSNGCGTTDPASLNVAAMPAEGLTAIRDVSTPCVGLSYEVEPVPGATSYVWSVPAGWSITSGQGTTQIMVTAGFGNGSISVVASNGGCTDEPVYLTPSPTMANSELHFPNVFSPNNDGTHDLWVIDNLTNYPDHEVTIINRWGNQVYHSKSYKNNWDGANLSEGTYYYVVRVKLCDGQDKMYKGYVMLIR